MNTSIYFIIVAILCLIIILLIAVIGRIIVVIDDFRKTIAQKYIPFEPSADKLVGLATDVWRLNRILQKIDESLGDNDRQRIKNSLNRINTYLISNDVDINDFSGRKYNDGMNVEILNVEYSDSVDDPTITHVNRPQVSYTGIIHQKAQVVISKPAPQLPDKHKKKLRSKKLRKTKESNNKKGKVEK